MAATITFDEHEGAVKRGEVVLAFRHGWKLPNGESFRFWFRGSNSMTGQESVAVTTAILNSESNISGEDLAQKIRALMN